MENGKGVRTHIPAVVTEKKVQELSSEPVWLMWRSDTMSTDLHLVSSLVPCHGHIDHFTLFELILFLAIY